MDRSIIEKYATGGQALRKSIAGLSAVDLSWMPPKEAGVGLWSVRQVVLHIADAEAAFADRVKRLIATEEPTLLAWDENKFAQKLFYDKQSAEDAATMVDLTRKQLAIVLRQLSDGDFARAGNHTERGKQTLAEVVNLSVRHLEHHLKFIEQKRANLGK